ncbi:hypothetical protein BASA81_009823 [Batrachochytrium salamandrivorans]|nr:hypothetical protein BASA81_009823 [Batrachochytrium salamandrivorans]
MAITKAVVLLVLWFGNLCCTVAQRQCTGLSESSCELNACYWYRTYCGPPRTFTCSYVEGYGCLPGGEGVVCSMETLVLGRECQVPFTSRLAAAINLQQLTKTQLWCEFAPQLLRNSSAACVRNCLDDASGQFLSLAELRQWCLKMYNATKSLPQAMEEQHCALNTNIAVDTCNGIIVQGLAENAEIRLLGIPRPLSSASSPSSSLLLLALVSILFLV